MLGDAQIGKTSLMVKYVEGTFDEDYIQTLGMILLDRALTNRLQIERTDRDTDTDANDAGVNFMEKSITLKNNEITFSIWDLGGWQRSRSERC